MKIITTNITDEQYSLLKQHSYAGKKEHKKEGEKTFSEHLREAIREYVNNNGMNKIEMEHKNEY